MNTIISKEDMQLLWSTSCPVTINDKEYRIHKMSYGDYFAEPADYQGGEKDMFHSDTLWFEKINKGKEYSVM